MWLCNSPGTGKITFFTSDFTSGDPHHGTSRHIFWHIFYLASLLTFYLAFYLTFYLTLYVTSCIEGSDWDLPLAVEARQCLLSSGALIKSRDPHLAASPGTWGTKTESLSGCFSDGNDGTIHLDMTSQRSQRAYENSANGVLLGGLSRAQSAWYSLVSSSFTWCYVSRRMKCHWAVTILFKSLRWLKKNIFDWIQFTVPKSSSIFCFLTRGASWAIDQVLNPCT